MHRLDQQNKLYTRNPFNSLRPIDDKCIRNALFWSPFETSVAEQHQELPETMNKWVKRALDTCRHKSSWVQSHDLAVGNPTHYGELHMYSIPWSSLTQLMACCLFSADSLPDAMQTYCQIESQEHNYNAVKFESNSIWKCCLQNVGYNTAISMCWKVILAKSFVILIHLLTHWGLVMPLGDIDLGQHWLR